MIAMIGTSQSVRDFTVVGGQLAHLTKLRFSANKTDKTGDIDKQNHHQKSVVTMFGKYINLQQIRVF